MTCLSIRVEYKIWKVGGIVFNGGYWRGLASSGTGAAADSMYVNRDFKNPNVQRRKINRELDTMRSMLIIYHVAHSSNLPREVG